MLRQLLTERLNKYDLSKYFNFIELCKNKNYTGNITHKHHIIPRHMKNILKEFNFNCPENLIDLSCEDHFEAHWILTHCFPENRGFYKANLNSCCLLFEWSRDPEKCRNVISKFRKGKCFRKKEELKIHSERMKGNKFRLGIPHSPEIKQKISEKSKISNRKRWPIPEGIFLCNADINGKLKKCYRICTCGTKIYYSNLETARRGLKIRSVCQTCTFKGRIFSEDHKNALLESYKTRKYTKPDFKDRTGKNNSNAKKVRIISENKIFDTMKECREYLNITYTILKTRLRKKLDLEYVK